MKICIPIKDNRGMDSLLSDHFGSAPGFLILDNESGKFEVIDNANEHHSHGMCQPLNALAGQKIDAIVCRGMGARAVLKLNQAGVRAFRADAATVRQLAEKHKDGEFEEITAQNACANHGCR